MDGMFVNSTNNELDLTEPTTPTSGARVKPGDKVWVRGTFFGNEEDGDSIGLRWVEWRSMLVKDSQQLRRTMEEMARQGEGAVAVVLSPLALEVVRQALEAFDGYVTLSGFRDMSGDECWAIIQEQTHPDFAAQQEAQDGKQWSKAEWEREIGAEPIDARP